MGPVRQRVNRAVFDYFVLKVTRVIPARQRTLAQVGDSIRRQLLAEARHRALAAFIAAWSERWTARTDCKPEYVVQKCRAYGGPRVAEEGLGGA